MISKVYIILSNQPFDSSSRTNKHFVAEELVKRGYRVIFVDPPTRFKFIKSILKKKKLELVSKKDENLYVYYPVNIFNFIPFSYLNNLIHSALIKYILRKWEMNNDELKIILWVYHFDFPKLFYFKKLINPRVFIDDVVDNYSAFPEYSQLDTTNKGLVKYIQKLDLFFRILLDQRGLSGKKWVNYQEKKLAKTADIMFASHPLLYKKFKKINKNITYNPNAGQFEIFSSKPKENHPLLVNILKPNVLYSGALDNYKFDSELFEYTVKKLPHVNFALVGPVNLSDSNQNINKLKKYKNVYFVGQIDRGDIYSYFFDAYIIPYRINDYTYYGCFPIKLYNALSTGVPVVVTELPAYEGLESVTYISKNKVEFVKNLRIAILDTDKEKVRQRIQVASKNTWVNKVNNQLIAINAFINNSKDLD